ncbi:ATP-grasp domain-containing protein [Brevibacterium antiquum]|uniref:ATP-grasp domain-containing protein n=1 Tax=Brevibacterium antiquum TaxID=234835 RepID=A0A2H1KMF4_9MICO|nr:ATP-grasp domain-containing protein [Brevibacterium antiquum]SMY00906.1 ATP-grasp domain-containing protein [Brevibacterium antiquum]
MTKVLILGGLAGQVDALESLRRRGVETHMCGHEKKGPGVDEADHFHIADITSVDAVKRVAIEIGADMVYSVGSDIAMPTVVRVSEDLGLPHFHGVELTDILRQKQEIRARLAAPDLSPVRFLTVEREDPSPVWNVFPAIVKPVDSQGQRGITLIQAAAEIDDAIAIAKENSVSGPVIIEEFLEGPEISAHVVVVDSEIKFFLPSDRFVWNGPLVGMPAAHSVPLREETAVWADEFRELAESIVTTLGVKEGPLYFQAICTTAGPRIIEIASRLDGCHLWRLLRFSTGFDLMDAVLGRLLGEPWPRFPSESEAIPMVLDFILDSPDTIVTPQYIDRVVRDDAIFSEVQTAENEKPRWMNDIVARIGYQIYEGGR